MPYRLQADAPVELEVRRIAVEQIDEAVAALRAAGPGDIDTAIHETRKRCKALRGLLRLVRPHLGDTYAAENAWYRDTSRLLSQFRDAHVRVQTFDKLTKRADTPLDKQLVGTLHGRLTDGLKADTAERGARVETAIARLREGRERAQLWRIDASGFDAVASGLECTYRLGRKAMKNAARKPSGSRFHEWRKHAKYHWHQLRLLEGLWEGPMAASIEQADALADCLGEDHDLLVLEQTLSGHSADADQGEIHRLVRTIEARQRKLRERALEIGERLYAEKPRGFCKRLGAYWKRSLRDT